MVIDRLTDLFKNLDTDTHEKTVGSFSNCPPEGLWSASEQHGLQDDAAEKSIDTNVLDTVF